MKKYMMMCFLLFSSIAIQAENKITMVTYFPVPYVAYSKINVNKQLDVGLTSTCEMNLGCSESGAAGLKPLQVTNGFLERGRLELNSATAVVSNQVSLGSGSGLAEINFLEDLRIGTLNNGYSLETNQMTVDILKLFPSRIKNDFPSCAATGAPNAPQVSWQKLKLKDKEEVFLVCGEAKDVGCDPSSKPATPSPRVCNGCGTQQASVSCNTSTGKWQISWGNCSVSDASLCATYSWQRDASMDCVFDPGSSGSSFFCPMFYGSVVGPEGPFNSGNSCNEVVQAARSSWSGPIGTTSTVKSGACSASQYRQLFYYHAVYNGFSLGALHTMGCVAYVCLPD